MEALADVPDWIIVTAAVITAFGVIWRKFVQPTAKLLAEIREALTYVQRELSFNGGSSMRDAIQRIDIQVRRLDDRLTQIETNTHRTTEIVEDITE